jgi:hypothetical protein
MVKRKVPQRHQGEGHNRFKVETRSEQDIDLCLVVDFCDVKFKYSASFDKGPADPATFSLWHRCDFDKRPTDFTDF